MTIREAKRIVEEEGYVAKVKTPEQEIDSWLKWEGDRTKRIQICMRGNSGLEVKGKLTHEKVKNTWKLEMGGTQLHIFLSDTTEAKNNGDGLIIRLKNEASIFLAAW
ncbi:hypothetical protein AGMMS49944_01730 [Spirochaetia bacterium]|nr:hypothetical protein AGMMS49944_01730 [Spirochaetia bacterium]